MLKTTCRRLGLLGLVFLATALSGCTHQTVSHVPDWTQRRAACGPVAVIPFENATANSQAGVIVADLFQNELRATQRFTLVAADAVAAKLAATAGQAKPTQEVAKLLGARSLVVGRVTEYTYKTGISEDPAVGVSIRLVDGKTGDVLWSGARSGVGKIAWIAQDSLGRLAQEVCQHLAEEMAEPDGAPSEAPAKAP